MLVKDSRIVNRFNSAMMAIGMAHRTMFTDWSENFDMQTSDDLVKECDYWLNQYDGRQFFSKDERKVLADFIKDFQ